MNNKFGIRLKQLRDERDMTLEELAAAIGGTKSNISKYEKGLVDPTLKVAIKTANYFGVTLDWIAGNDSERTVMIPDEYESVIDKCIKSKISAEKLNKMIDIIK